MAAGRVGAGGIALRILFATALVLVTWNPSGHSFVTWALAHAAGETAYVALAGVTLLILYVIFVRATLFSIGTLGVVLAAAFLGALVWVLNDAGLLDLDQGATSLWVAQICIGIVLGIGMAWSHIRRRLSGQVDVDDVDD